MRSVTCKDVDVSDVIVDVPGELQHPREAHTEEVTAGRCMEGHHEPHHERQQFT